MCVCVCVCVYVRRLVIFVAGVWAYNIYRLVLCMAIVCVYVGVSLSYACLSTHLSS